MTRSGTIASSLDRKPSSGNGRLRCSNGSATTCTWSAWHSQRRPDRQGSQGGLALRATEAHLEGSQKLVQLGQRGWTGVYSHGHPPFLSKDTSCKSKLTK